MKKLIRFALFGAVGFGIGMLCSYNAPDLAFDVSFQPDWALRVVRITVSLLGLVVRGAIGGMALGLALGRSKKALAIFCCIGFIAGNFLAFPVSWDNYKLGLAIEGAIGGASLGLALKNIRKVIGLAIAGALGLPLGWLIADYIPGDSAVLYLVWSSLPGIIIGALLGATLAYLGKE